MRGAAMRTLTLLALAGVLVSCSDEKLMRFVVRESKAIETLEHVRVKGCHATIEEVIDYSIGDNVEGAKLCLEQESDEVCTRKLQEWVTRAVPEWRQLMRSS